jgi:hypothetical protein
VTRIVPVDHHSPVLNSSGNERVALPISRCVSFAVGWVTLWECMTNKIPINNLSAKTQWLIRLPAIITRGSGPSFPQVATSDSGTGAVRSEAGRLAGLYREARARQSFCQDRWCRKNGAAFAAPLVKQFQIASRLLSRTRQSGGLRAVAGRIRHLQRSRRRSRCGWSEDHVDGARGIGG